MANYIPALIEDEKLEMSAMSKNDTRYINPLNKALRVFFKEAVRVSLKNPSQAFYFYQTVRNQQRASSIRTKWEKEGLHVPPIMILSITNRCNLHCKGCYHQALRDVSKAEMSEEKLRSVIGEGRDLGVSFMVLAGGEPLVRKDILDITRDFPDVIFLMFTNGLLITDEMIERFKAQKNIVPLISIEGYDRDTDSRRGNGVYERLQGIVNRLKKQDVFFGVSITVTRSNFPVVTDDSFVGNLNDLGCKFLLFAEYTPVNEVSADWVITDEQRINLNSIMSNFRDRYAALFISVPGDEKDFGGCLAAGRGFVHISAEGDLEPCPFAPYSDTNLREMSLKEALQSRFLKAIRESKDHAPETGGSCALWAKREWVKSLLAAKNETEFACPRD
jgi:MoaA/NifB/PqqE/SkfB family radical SAM enzyme